MSVHITSAVWKHSKASGAALLVLLSLADQADDTGLCWPSVANVAARCRVSRRSVHRYLEELEALGEVVVTTRQREGKPSYYRIMTTCQSDIPPADLREGGMTELRHRGYDTALAQGYDTVGTQKHQEPSVEPSVKNSPSSGDDGARSFDEFWQAYPRKIGKGQARTAYNRACRKATPELILSSLRVLLRAYQGQSTDFIPHPATWLNGERWTDDPEAVARHPTNGRQVEADDQFARMLARAAERDQQKAISQ